MKQIWKKFHYSSFFCHIQRDCNGQYNDNISDNENVHEPFTSEEHSFHDPLSSDESDDDRASSHPNDSIGLQDYSECPNDHSDDHGEEDRTGEYFDYDVDNQCIQSQ